MKKLGPHLKQRFCFTLSIFLMLSFGPSLAEQSIVIPESSQTSYPHVGKIHIAEDVTQSWTVDEVSTSPIDERFELYSGESFDFGLTQSAYWLRFKVTNSSGAHQEVPIELSTPSISQITLYQQSPTNTWLASQAGLEADSQVRQIQNQRPVFELIIPAGDTQIYYLRVQSKQPLRFSLMFWQSDAFASKSYGLISFSGIYYGMFLMMSIYSLLMFLLVKDRTYLYFAGFIVTLIGVRATIDGNFSRYILDVDLQGFFGLLSVLLLILFTRRFIETPKYLPRFDRVLIASIFIGIFFLILPFIHATFLASASQFIVLIDYALVMYAAIHCWIKGSENARSFIIAWSMLLLGVTIYILMLNGVLPENIVTINMARLGSILLVLFLSFAMAARINRLNREVLVAQQSALDEAVAKQKFAEENIQLQTENLRMNAELDVTRKLQEMILPDEQELNAVADLDISGFMLPADEVGGDYYDVLNYDNHTIIGIGDVTGHGLASGLMMFMVQTTIRALKVGELHDSRTFFKALNTTLYDNVARMKLDKNMTLLVADYQTGTLRISGQHEEILVFRANGDIERVDTVDLGFILAVERNIDRFISDCEVHLEPGDGIVLYTDGITEAFNEEGEIYGVERLCNIVQTNCHQNAATIQHAVISDLMRYAGEHELLDDVTLLVIKRKRVISTESGVNGAVAA
ncbi:MAG: SpoIIE family protein phosphatase [Pseudomonadota bacterium]